MSKQGNAASREPNAAAIAVMLAGLIGRVGRNLKALAELEPAAR